MRDLAIPNRAADKYARSFRPSPLRSRPRAIPGGASSEARNAPSSSGDPAADCPLDFPCLHIAEFITRSNRVRVSERLAAATLRDFTSAFGIIEIKAVSDV